MIAYIFGAGASAAAVNSENAKYPLASKLLHALSEWLDNRGKPDRHVETFRRVLLQLRTRFSSLDDFEGILASLGNYDTDRVGVGSNVSQAQRDDLYLREGLVSAVREYFFFLESHRPGATAYDAFARRRVSPGNTVITFNYDIALERALKRAETWDIGSGYGFELFGERPRSRLVVLKLHGSTNWFQSWTQTAPPPLMLSRDLEMLGYHDIKDPRIGPNGDAVDNGGTLILPDRVKQFPWNELWDPLWEAAARGLRRSQQVSILGYSLPPADVRARRLLFDNVDRHTSIHIFCKGDSERIAAEFRKAGFTEVWANIETGFEDWATQTA